MANKFDDGKLRFDLLEPGFLAEMALVATIGAKKYGDNNWREKGGLDWGQVIAALHRHINRFEQGESYDQIDGQHHLGSVAWCAMALWFYEKEGSGKDDRWVSRTGSIQRDK